MRIAFIVVSTGSLQAMLVCHGFVLYYIFASVPMQNNNNIEYHCISSIIPKSA